MKKIHAIVLLLFGVLVLGAITAASSFAEEETTAQWLANNAAIPAARASTTSIELLIEETIPLIGKAAVLCGMLLDGTVGPGMEGSITSVLNLSGEAISELATGLGLVCEAKETCAAGPDVEFRPKNLPWDTLVDLMMPAGTFLNILHPAFKVTCLIGGGAEEDSCEGLTSAELKNVAAGVETIFSAGVGTEKLECDLGGENTGTIISEGTPLTTLNNGEPLTVSE